MTDQKLPSKNYRSMVLVLLTIVYGFNFIDRQIVGILAPFIQADLGLTNTQLGLLIGLAFATFYTLIAIPIAWLADRYNRVNILAVALAVWSGFTALTGLAGNFMQIGLARMGVGVGEAGGSPPSHSIISDLYPKEERAGALGVYSMGIPLGIMAAYFATASLMGSSGEDVD
ncbi:MFS transporter, partial [Porticoccaceae bacterium]|nr:MFS transporter [Porticoccaceae bacterium]